MSYDVHIIINTGGEYPAEVEDVGNITCNIGPMYDIAMPGPYKDGGVYNGWGCDPDPQGGLTGLSGLQCSVAATIIADGLQYMKEHEKELTELEPKNGWGSFDGAFGFLTKILIACRNHPLATLGVNW